MDKQIILPHLQIKKILARLKGRNEADDEIDFISLSRLKLSPSDKIQFKWETRTDTELVNWLIVKLIGVPSGQRSIRDKYLTQLQAVYRQWQHCSLYSLQELIGNETTYRLQYVTIHSMN